MQKRVRHIANGHGLARQWRTGPKIVRCDDHFDWRVLRVEFGTTFVDALVDIVVCEVSRCAARAERTPKHQYCDHCTFHRSSMSRSGCIKMESSAPTKT